MNNREKRVDENEILFRAVNERIVELDKELGVNAGELRFICECGLLLCEEPIVLTMAQYERVRSQPDQFVIIPGHEITSVEEVVEANGHYDIVRKPTGDLVEDRS